MRDGIYIDGMFLPVSRRSLHETIYSDGYYRVSSRDLGMASAPANSKTINDMLIRSGNFFRMSQFMKKHADSIGFKLPDNANDIAIKLLWKMPQHQFPVRISDARLIAEVVILVVDLKHGY